MKFIKRTLMPISLAIPILLTLSTSAFHYTQITTSGTGFSAWVVSHEEGNSDLWSWDTNALYDGSVYPKSIHYIYRGQMNGFPPVTENENDEYVNSATRVFGYNWWNPWNWAYGYTRISDANGNYGYSSIWFY
jgi:hypothetical protein